LKDNDLKGGGEMLSSLSRKLTFLSGVSFFLLGLLLFIAPGWSSDNFGWKISPLVAITMGAWYLGAGAMTFVGAWFWDWSRVRSLLIFYWVFALGESVIIVLHRQALQWGSILAVPYVIILSLASIGAIISLVDWARVRPKMIPMGVPVPALVRIASAIFVVYVLLLVWLLIDGISPNGKIWPGPLTLLTARAFAAIYFALTVAQFFLIFVGGMTPYEYYFPPALFLAASIEIAALIFFERWDLVNKPGQWIYHLTYLIAVTVPTGILIYTRMVKRRIAQPHFADNEVTVKVPV
jgi:hypothetical protein